MSFLLFWSVLSFIGINYASTALTVSNGSAIAPKFDAVASITTLGASIKPSSKSLLQASASCFSCFGSYIVDQYSWWDKTETRIAATIVLVVDNSTNFTSTSTITSKPPPEEIESVYAFAVHGETVFLTYPTSYIIQYLFEREIASLNYVASANGSLVEPYYTCTHETSSYSNIFALTAGTGEIVDTSFLNFASSIGLIPRKPGCTFVQWGVPHILTPVSLLTATSTSFGSFPRTATTTIKPSPPSGPVLLVASPTEFKPSPSSGSDLLVASPTEFSKPPSKSKPTQDIPNNNEVQEKLPETTTQTVIPAPSIVATHEGISRPKEIQPVPDEPVLFTLPGNQIITAGANVASISEYIIGDHTLTPGGSITVSGKPIYLAPSASEVIIGSQNIHPQPLTPSSPQPIIIGGQTLTAQSDKLGYIIDGHTLAPGGTITVSGTPIYLAPSASEVIIGSQTVHLQQPSPSSPQTIIIGGQTLTAQSDRLGYIIDDHTLNPGGSITVSGTPIYLAPSASEVIIGSQTVHLHPPSPSSPQTIVIGGQTLRAQSVRSGYIINGQTIQPGSPAIIIAGKSVSLDPSMSALIIIDSSSSTIPLITPFPTVAAIPGKTIAPKSTSEYGYIIDSQTLRPGYPAITVSGIAISLAPSASALVIIGGTKTSPLTLFTTPGAVATASSTSTLDQPGPGDLILGGFNSATPGTATEKAAPQAFSGKATSVRSSYPERLIIFIIIVIVNIGICIWL